ncbi:MAG: hypothetical protein U5O39_12960 [Gammaproteobacteria bacterium]|nr:hypothetical protein [Gammaproteobacteria bacterium]
MPLIEMTLPSLRQLSRAQYERFLENVDALIEADQSISLSEWALKKYLAKHLGAAFDRRHGKQNVKKRSMRSPKSVRCCYRCSPTANSQSGISPEVAFEAGRAELEQDIALVDKSALRLTHLNDAVDRLADLRPLRKPKLLKACIATITVDRVVAPVGKELVRAIASALWCPMPPSK